MNKEFSFGQHVKYDGHDGVCIITGKAITDPSGNPTDDWWWLATPDLPSILTHAKNIEAIETPWSPLSDDEIERLVSSPVEITSSFGSMQVGMSERQKSIVRAVLRWVRERYCVSESQQLTNQ